VADEQSLTTDPDNYLLAVRRAAADGDAVRYRPAIAGTLNPKGGVVIRLPGGDHSPRGFQSLAGGGSAEHNRRSIYLQMKSDR
jgi:hypothetical protein